MRQVAGWCALAALAWWSPFASAAEPGATRVSYLAGGSVYLEAGRRDGLAEGDTLEVVSQGRRVARLVVRYLSTARAVCDTVGALRMPAIGDAVRYQARPSAEVATPETAPSPAVSDTAPGMRAAAEAPPAPADRARREGRLRGRIGLRTLSVEPRGGAGYTQPALELRLDGENLGGSPMDLAVDMRGRRTFHGAAGIPDDGEARVYRLSASLHDGSGRRRVTLGRQLSSSLAAVSLVDGALVEYAGERWGAGLLSGASPDPASFQASTAVLQHGAFVTRREREGARRWSATTGLVASFDHGHVDRQYAFLHGSWLDPRLALSLAQELDLHTGWKRAFGGSVVSLTNTFASARVQVASRLSLHAGFDDRRTVRLYRDRETPETDFDDRHRRGGWVGFAAPLMEHLRVSGDGRWSGGGPAGSHHSLSGAIEVPRLGLLQADARWRTTRYEGDRSSGWMHAGGLAVRPWGLARVELGGGLRTTTDVLSGFEGRTRWESGDLDLGFASRWYLLLSAQHDHGDGYDAMQWHGSISRMF